MKVTATMIGTTGDCTLSAVVRCLGGHFYGEARAFDHPDPAITIPSGTRPKHVVKAEGASREDAIQALEAALIAQIGPLNWVRWNLVTDKAG
jgi:hypothetical protein